LVELFNDHELSSPGGRLSLADYQLFLLAHLIVLDTVNGRYLWKRIPKAFRDDAGLSEIWAVGQALDEKDFARAFNQIGSLKRSLSSDSERNGTILKMLEVLHRVLRESHVLKVVKLSYSSIDIPQVRALFGFTAEESDASVQAFLARRGFTFDSQFVHIPHNTQGAVEKPFTLDQERVAQLAQTV
jgi:CSN8/PSMD8/EIF3K family